MIRSKTVQLTVLFIFLLVNVYLPFEYNTEISFILVYGGYAIVLGFIAFLSLIFFVSIRFQWYTVYHSAYFLTATSLTLWFVFTLKKPVRDFLNQRKSERYIYENSGGRGVFDTELETKAAVAIYNGDTIALKHCIQMGLNVNPKGKNPSLLAFAIGSGNASPSIIRLLLDHGADPNVIDRFDHSLAWLWNESYFPQDKEILRLLLRKGLKIPYKWFNYRDEAVSVFLESGVSIDQKFKVDYYQIEYKGSRITWSPENTFVKEDRHKRVLRSAEWTPIMVLAANSWLEKAEEFRARGADIFYEDENGVDLLEILQSKKILITDSLSYFIDDAERFELFIQKIKANANSPADLK